FETREVVGREGFTLQDREVDLDLVQPTGMHGRVNRDNPWPAFLDTIDTSLAAMGGPIVHGPEDPARRAIGLLGHDVFHQAGERLNAGLVLATTVYLRPAHVPGRQVGPAPLAFVFVLGAHGFSGRGR